MPKPWAADDRPKEWVCPNCRALIPKGAHKPDCAMKLENPTRQEIDDCAVDVWKKNVSYAAKHWKVKIEFYMETLGISRDTAALFYVIDNSSLNIQASLQSLGMDPETQEYQKAVLREAARELRERKKADDWKQGGSEEDDPE